MNLNSVRVVAVASILPEHSPRSLCAEGRLIDALVPSTLLRELPGEVHGQELPSQALPLGILRRDGSAKPTLTANGRVFEAELSEGVILRSTCYLQ